jgi:glycine/D-amino acid oxidase-like deaminating enzyme
MNIAQIISGGGKNGAAVHCALVARSLAERGHQVVLVHRPAAGSVRNGLFRTRASLDRWGCPRAPARSPSMASRRGMDLTEAVLREAAYGR